MCLNNQTFVHTAENTESRTVLHLGRRRLASEAIIVDTQTHCDNTVFLRTITPTGVGPSEE